MKQNKKYFNSLIKTIVESTPSTNLIFQSCLYTFSKMIEDFALLNILLSDSFPKELNKPKIREIFEILQNQERPDLAQEMKNLLLLKTDENNASKRKITNSIDLPLINKVLPTEMLKKVLEHLDYKSMHNAKQSFKHWKDIIDEFKLVEHAISKFLQFYCNHIYLISIIFHFRKNNLCHCC